MTLLQTASVERENMQKPRNVGAYLRFTLRNNWQQLVLSFVLCFIGIFLPTLLSMPNLSYGTDFVSYDNARYSWEEVLFTYAENMVQITGVLFCIVFAVLGVIFGMTANSYTNSKPSVHTCYSFPLRRTTMFFTDWLTCGLYCLCTGTIVFGLSNVYIAMSLRFSAALFGQCMLFWLAGVCGYFMVFALFQLAAALTGTAAFRFCMAGIIAFLPMVLYLLLIGCAAHGMENLWTDYYLSDEVLRYLSPAYLLLETIMRLTDDGIADGILITVVYAFVFGVLAVLLQRKRKSELSGSSIVWRKIQTLVKYLVIFTGGLGGGWFFSLFAGNSVSWTIFGLTCGLILSFLLMNVLIDRSVKGMFHGLKGFGITALCSALLFSVLFFDVFEINDFLYTDSATRAIRVYPTSEGSVDADSILLVAPEDMQSALAEVRNIQEWSAERKAPQFIMKLSECVNDDQPLEALKLLYDLDAGERGYKVEKESLWLLRTDMLLDEDGVVEYGEDFFATSSIFYVVYPKCGIPIARCVRIEALTESDGWADMLFSTDEYTAYLLDRLTEMRTGVMDWKEISVDFDKTDFSVADFRNIPCESFEALLDAYIWEVENGGLNGTLVGKMRLRDGYDGRQRILTCPVYSGMTGVWEAFLTALDADLFVCEESIYGVGTNVAEQWLSCYGLDGTCPDITTWMTYAYPDVFVVEENTGRFWYVEDDKQREEVLVSAVSLAAYVGMNTGLGMGKSDLHYAVVAVDCEGTIHRTAFRDGEVPACVYEAFSAQ